MNKNIYINVISSILDYESFEIKKKILVQYVLYTVHIQNAWSITEWIIELSG